MKPRPSRDSGTIIVVVRELALARASECAWPRSDPVFAVRVSAMPAPSLPAISAVVASSVMSGTPISSPRAARLFHGGSWARRPRAMASAMRVNAHPSPVLAAYSSASLMPAPAVRDRRTSCR